jgi:hypothetical protein
MKLSHFTTSSLIDSSASALIGYSMKATADSEVVIRNGDDTGDGVVFILLGEGQSIIVEANIELDEGVYVDIISGAVEGSLWVR